MPAFPTRKKECDEKMETHRELFLEYESRDELVHALQDLAIKEGFCIRIFHSNPVANKVRLCCDRQGKSTSQRKQMLTKRVGCTFEILAKKHALTGKWRFVRRSGDHNHALMPGPRFHKMTHAQREHRAQLVQAGLKTIDQVAFLQKTYPTLLVTYRDLINDDVRLRALAQQQQELGLSSGESDGGDTAGGNGNDDGDDDDNDDYDEEMDLAAKQQQQQPHARHSNASRHPPLAASLQQQQRTTGNQYQHNNTGCHPAFSSSHATTNSANHAQPHCPPIPTAHTAANYSQHQQQHLHLPQRAPVQMPSPQLSPPPQRAPRFLSPSPLQRMLETLQSFSSTMGATEYVYTYKVECESGGPSNVDRITHLFVAHRKSLELVREFHDVLSVELAKPHKIGKGMSLLLCSSQTPFNVPFLCAGVFIDTLFKRRVFFKADYKWALNAIEGALCMGSENGYCVGNAVSVIIGDTSDEPELLEAQQKTFPNANLVVSRARMKKALVLKWRQHFPADQQLWDDMVENYEAMCDAVTPDAFEEQWTAFQAKEFASSVPGFLTYVKEKVLVYKEKFMAAWVDDQFHLGTTLNGSSSFWTHAVKKKTDSVLKKFRPRLGLDLLKLWTAFDADMERQYWDVRRCHSDEETFRLLSCDEHLYSQVNYRIASRALSLVHEYIEAIQIWAQGREHEFVHSEKHFRSMGLPSFSVIRDRVLLNTPFEVADFHRFWRIERVGGSNELTTAAAELPGTGSLGGLNPSQPLSPFDDAVLRLRERFSTVTPLMQTKILAQINRITSTSAPAYPLPAAASTIVQVVPTTTRKRIRPRTTNQVRLCSLCNETGHNSRSCHIRIAYEQIQEQQMNE